MARRGDKALLVLVALAAAVFLAAPVVANEYNSTMQGDVVAILKRFDQEIFAGLVRLLFHDCWVNGCDASVLLATTPFSGSGGKMEKDSDRNNGLRALDVIDAIKKDLGRKYGMTCTDAVIYAAREATIILSKGKIAYNVSGPGRRDGVVSKKEDADFFLPGSTLDFADLLANFKRKEGFGLEELVVLSGAHSIGQCNEDSFKDRLAAAPKKNGEIDGPYQCAIKNIAEKNKGVVKNNVRDIDFRANWLADLFRLKTCEPLMYDSTGVDKSGKGKDILDNSYYTNNIQKMVLLRSDWELTLNKEALDKIKEYKDKPLEWNADFGDAMDKLSKLEAKATYSEIRDNCRATNGKDQAYYKK